MVNTTKPEASATRYEPSDYERGMLDALHIVRAVTDTLHDAEIETRRITHDAAPAMRALLAGVNASANIASHIRAEVEKAAMRHLNERRNGGAHDTDCSKRRA